MLDNGLDLSYMTPKNIIENFTSTLRNENIIPKKKIA